MVQFSWIPRPNNTSGGGVGGEALEDMGRHNEETILCNRLKSLSDHETRSVGPDFLSFHTVPIVYFGSYKCH